MAVSIPNVMRGLGPRIHVFSTQTSKDVDGRDKPGHDEDRKLGPGSATQHFVLRRARGHETSYRGNSAASATLTDASACAAPWLRSGGCARASPRTAGRLLPGC